MKQREPKDRKGLLQDLESIRTLLDEEQPAQTLDIPLLEDIITSGTDRPEPAPTPPPTASAEKAPNPFLPYESLAKLAGERVQLERLLQQSLSPTTPSPHTGAREVRMEERLHADAQLIMQDVIDEILPLIEAELRKRLNGRLQQLVEEQLGREGSAGLCFRPLPFPAGQCPWAAAPGTRSASPTTAPHSAW